VDEMQKGILKILAGAVILLVAQSGPSLAEDKIQSFVSPAGKLVFTNLVDNSPDPGIPSQAPDVVATQVPPPLSTLVDAIATNHGVDPALVRAVMKTESNFNRWAVSPKGALGLMQLIPATGRRYGVRDFFDPQQNVDGGVRHLKFLLEKFNGNLDLSLAAYNAGENLVARLGRIPAIPETTNYVRRIRALYRPQPVDGAVTAPSVQVATANEVQDTETHRIFRNVDQRGVIHFSNIEPPN
jgi:hypothetical protein